MKGFLKLTPNALCCKQNAKQNLHTENKHYAGIVPSSFTKERKEKVTYKLIRMNSIW